MPGNKSLIPIALTCLVWGSIPAAQAPETGPSGPAPDPPAVTDPAKNPARPAPGTRAPLFTVPDLDGRSVDVAAVLEGRPALLAFWASWCQPCMEEIPTLRGLARTYRQRGFTILGIGVQEGGETPEKQRKAAARQLINYQLVFDSQAAYQETWGLSGLPYNVLLDHEGNIAWQGQLLPTDLDERVRELIVKARRRGGTPQG